MFRPEFYQIWDWVKEWKPSKKYDFETEYRDDLFIYLREYLRGSKKGRLQRKSKIVKESGRERCDIEIDEKYGIELKKDLRKKHIDRLMGQLGRYTERYENVGVVVCGVAEIEAWDDLEDKIKDRYQPLLGSNKVELIRK